MRILVPLVLVLGCATASAQLYSWKDADGKVHYSDQPPTERTPVRKLTAPPPPPAAAAAKGSGEKDAKKTDEAAKAEKDKIAANPEKDKEKEAELRRYNCDRARGTLQALESGTIRFGVNPKGERIALEGATLQAELDNARKAVDSWCK
jgi:hypothetical protein